MKLRLLFLLPLFALLSNCTEKNTTNPAEAYKMWSFEPTPKDMKVTEGQYWQSAHFTREYVVYLHLHPSAKWSNWYIRQNNLRLQKITVITPVEAPAWFKPGGDYARFTRPGDNNSSYWFNTGTGDWFIFEQQL